MSEAVDLTDAKELVKWYPPRRYCDFDEALWRLQITHTHWELLRATDEMPAGHPRWNKLTWEREVIEHRLSILDHVYFLEMTDFIKIGFSTQLEFRLEAFETSMPYEVKLLHSIAGSRNTERFLHKKFCDLRGRGEWFKRDDRILEYIEALKL